MKSKTQWRSAWSLILIILILSSESVGVVRTIKIAKSHAQSINPTKLKAHLKKGQDLSIPGPINNITMGTQANQETVLLQTKDLSSDQDTDSRINMEAKKKEGVHKGETSLTNSFKNKKKSANSHEIKKSETENEKNPYSNHFI